MTNLPLSQTASRQIIDKLISKWIALCKWQDDVSTEVVVEAVNIPEGEKHQILYAMDTRVMRQQAENEDAGPEDHDMPVPLWYVRLRGSSCSSNSSDESNAASPASRESVALAEVWDGSFKAWPKEEVADDVDVWRFRRESTKVVEQIASTSTSGRKIERQSNCGTCAQQ